jgi:hypothetical protein
MRFESAILFTRRSISKSAETAFASYVSERAIARSAYVKATQLFGSGSERTKNTTASGFDECFSYRTCPAHDRWSSRFAGRINPETFMSAWRRPSSPFGARQFRILSTVCSNYALAGTARMSRKGLGYPAASNEAAAVQVHFCQRRCKMQVTGTEKGTNVVFLHTTVDDGDHFQPRTLSGDAQVPLAKTPNAFGAARSHRKFSQREINAIRTAASGRPCGRKQINTTSE